LVDHGLLDHAIRPKQDRLWDRQPQGLGRLEVYHQLELRGLLDGQIARLGAFQNLVDITGSAPMKVDEIGTICNEAPPPQRPRST